MLGFPNPFRRRDCEDEFDTTSYFDMDKKYGSMRPFSGENSTHKVMEEVYGRKVNDSFKIHHNEFT